MPRPIHRMTPEQALAYMLGDKTYTGAPCRKCNSTKRYTTTGNCINCAKEHSCRQYAACREGRK